MLAIAAAGDADVGFPGFAGSVDDAAKNAERHRRLDVLQPIFERLDRADDVKALASAAGAGDDTDSAIANTERLQDLVADADFFLGLGRQRYADGVADSGPQQVADTDRRLHRTADQATGFGNAEVERAVNFARQLLVGRNGEEDVARLHRNLVVAEAVILENADMVERAFDQGLGAGLAVFFEQVLFEVAGVDPDTDRAAVGACRRDHFLDALFRADVARIDAEARRAGVRGLERTLVVKVDVGDDRHAGRAGFFAAADLGDRRRCVLGRRVGHGLDADRRVAADRHGTDHDLPRLAPLDIAPGT